MFTRRDLGRAALALPALSLATPRTGAAQGAAPGAAGFPAHTVTMVVPWAAGGSTDTVARILAARLSQDTGKSFVIDNRAGANGTIGFASVARARPDGHTLLVGTVSTYAMAPHLYNLPYDNAQAFTGVGLIAAQPMILVVPKASPARSLAEFVALAKQPGHTMTFANSGTGSSTHRRPSCSCRPPGCGSAMSATAPARRRCRARCRGGLHGHPGRLGPAAADPGGELRPLAISSRERSAVAPEIPTFREQGFPEYEAEEHIALLAPAGTPAEIVTRMHALTRDAMTAPETRERLAALAVTPETQTPAEWPAYHTAENAKWRAVIRSRNITVQ
ncbi:Bug family tripartite tricarboxylate transporter substrate binding protein [Teichococcus aestuarii]|uniref:Bug family tripartite tricarboxylate transporter substrate binding protein n=1 Tax=Teichococcus aestuarii TaxID=568898 RepID=UPI00360F7C6C